MLKFLLISQLNTDTKILSKISANRLKPVLPDLVHPDQTGFIPSIERLGNSKLLIGYDSTPIPDYASSSVLTLRKAFDRVDWLLMAETQKLVPTH